MSSIPYSRYLIYPVPWYSVLIVTGMILAVIISCRGERRIGLPKDTVIDLALRLLPCGIVGARIYYVIFSWDQFRGDFLSIFRIWEGGIAIYGGIIGGFAALFFFCRSRKLSLLSLCDVIAPGLALAQGIGRWGNWFNIEAYGMKVVHESLCFFPVSVQVPADGYAWHLAAFFYESIWDFCIFLFLIFTRYRKLRRKGDVFFFYLFLYAAGRLVIEETRLDSLYLFSSIRVSQLFSVIICMSVLFLYLSSLRKTSPIPQMLRFFLLPLTLLGIAFSLVYSIAGSAFSTWSHGIILLGLSVSAALMILCLFFIRFSPACAEVRHADD